MISTNDRPHPIEVPEQFRLLVVGDWGTGLPRAQKVAEQMRKVLLKGQADGLTAQHVVHLGDVYYSGWDHEYRRRFLPYGRCGLRKRKPSVRGR
jgi:hypothetical protein